MGHEKDPREPHLTDYEHYRDFYVAYNAYLLECSKRDPHAPPEPNPHDFTDYDDYEEAYKNYLEQIGLPRTVYADLPLFKTWLATYQASLQDPAQTPQREDTAPTLGTDTETRKSVTLKDKHRTRHISIIGKTGYGKTTLLEHLILDDIRSGTSAILIDPHGDLSQRIIMLTDSEERARITLLEEWPDRPFRLNLLECSDPTQLNRTVDDTLILFTRLFDLGGTPGLRLERFLGNTLRTLIPNNRPLTDVKRLFRDDQFRAALLSNVQNRNVLEFWQEYDQIPQRDRLDLLESTINRLDRFLSSETAYAMVNTTKTTIPLSNILDSDGQLLLVRIPVGELGEQQARFYGSLFLSLLTDRLFSRAQLPKSKRPRLHLYLDEYGWFATSTTAALLQQARKYNLGATIAFQTLADLPDEKNKQAALQVGTFAILQLVGQNADELVSNFPVEPRAESRETLWEPADRPRPIKRITHKPVEHLLNRPHDKTEATKAATALLIPLDEAAKEEERNDRGPTVRTDPLEIIPPQTDIRDALRLLNELLITVMERGQDTRIQDIAQAAAEVFITLGERYYKLPPVPLGYAHKPRFEPLTRHAGEGFVSILTNYIKYATFGPDPSCAEEHANEGIAAIFPWSYLKNHMIVELKERDNWGNVHTFDDRIAEASARIRTDIAHLITLCKILAQQPILAETGQEEEYLRPREIIHPAQTHADARLELAGILANLKEYTAFYQTPKAHGQVELTPPSEPDDHNEEAVTEIRNRSKQLYGVPIEDDRTTPTPPPAPARPRISRRPID